MLSVKLCVKSATKTLLLADAFGETELKKKVLTFINDNLDVLKTDEFKKVTDLQLLHETFQSIATKKTT